MNSSREQQQKQQQQQQQQQNNPKIVTFKRYQRSLSSSQFSNRPPTTQNQPHNENNNNKSQSYKKLIDVLNSSNQQKQINTNLSSTRRDDSRRSSYLGKYTMKDNVSRDDQKEDIHSHQKEKVEVENLQEWIDLQKFGKKSSYQEQIENIISMNEVRQRPDIRTDMVDDIMNSSDSHVLEHNNKSKHLFNKNIIKTKNTQSYSSLADKQLYKSSDYAKSYITNKNLLNQILQKKMKQLTEDEEEILKNKEMSISHMDNLNRTQTDMNLSYFMKTKGSQYSPIKNSKTNYFNKDQVRFVDAINELPHPNEVMTLKKILSQNIKEQNENINNSYPMNKLQKLTNTQAKSFINKFSGLQTFKRDICKSIIDYQAIRDVIVQSQSENKQNQKNDRRSSSSQSKILTLYQPDYPLEKYKKKKNSTQEEDDPYLKQEEQEKIQQYEAIREISSSKRNEYLMFKTVYKKNKERVIQLGLEVIQLNQQIQAAKLYITEYTSKMGQNLQKLSNNKKSSTGFKNQRGVRFSNTDHDRMKLSQYSQIDEKQDETEITFAQFNQDYPASPLKRQHLSKQLKEKKYSEFEEIENAIEQKKLDLKGLEKRLLEVNITIERLKEDLQLLQRSKKDTLFDLKKLYQVFIKNQDNWKYDKVLWVLDEMQLLKQPLTNEYFPSILENQSKEYLKQIQALKAEDKELDTNWIKWKNQYKMNSTMGDQIEQKSQTNLLEKIKGKIKIIRQSNIEITVKRKSDRSQCQETLNKLMDQAHQIMNQDGYDNVRTEKIESQFNQEENNYNEKKKQIQEQIDTLTKQEINRLFTKYPISRGQSFNDIKNIFYIILSDFQAKRFSKKYQLLSESSAMQEQKNKKGIDYEELREKIKSSLNKTASLKVVQSSSTGKRRAISKDSQSFNNNKITQSLNNNTTLNTTTTLNQTDKLYLNNTQQIFNLNLPYLNMFDFYGMKTPQGNYIVL